MFFSHRILGDDRCHFYSSISTRYGPVWNWPVVNRATKSLSRKDTDRLAKSIILNDAIQIRKLSFVIGLMQNHWILCSFPRNDSLTDLHVSKILGKCTRNFFWPVFYCIRTLFTQWYFISKNSKYDALFIIKKDNFYWMKLFLSLSKIS